jgi:hypothetical protein
MADINDKTTRVGTDNFDRVTGDEGLNKTASKMNGDIGNQSGTMNAPGQESKDFGQQQKPDINKTPLV